MHRSGLGCACAPPTLGGGGAGDDHRERPPVTGRNIHLFPDPAPVPHPDLWTGGAAPVCPTGPERHEPAGGAGGRPPCPGPGAVPGWSVTRLPSPVKDPDAAPHGPLGRSTAPRRLRPAAPRRQIGRAH